MKILLIEDEYLLRKSMVQYLTSEYYLCEWAKNYKEAIEKIELYQYDCIVVDIMLPDGNGIDIVKTLKLNKRTDGIIILSAKNELDDKIKGLNLGADDYLTKPFHLPELSTRIAAIIRRKNMQGNNKMVFEEIEIDVQGKIVTVDTKNVILTRKEFELLLYFIINKNRVLSKNSIAQHLWGDDMDIVDSYDFLYAHIKNLRKKLVFAGAGDYLHSVYGMGYKFSTHL